MINRNIDIKLDFIFIIKMPSSEKFHQLRLLGTQRLYKDHIFINVFEFISFLYFLMNKVTSLSIWTVSLFNIDAALFCFVFLIYFCVSSKLVRSMSKFTFRLIRTKPIFNKSFAQLRLFLIAVNRRFCKPGRKLSGRVTIWGWKGAVHFLRKSSKIKRILSAGHMRASWLH